VTAGTVFAAAGGFPQSFDVAQPPTTTPVITNTPSGAVPRATFVAAVQTNGDGTTSVTSSTGLVCTVGSDGLTVTFTAVGTCTLTAHVTAGVVYAAADGIPQSFSISAAVTTAPRVANVPSGASFGGTFVALVETNGDGTTSVTSGTKGVCTVGNDGVTVTFTAVGTCTLTAHVTAGTLFPAADGNPESFVVSQAVPTVPFITNVPIGAVVGGRFTASISTNSTGKTSVTSQTPTVCAVAANGLKVTFVASGSCTLVPSVAGTKNYVPASGSEQFFPVQP
jgi:hypothetical protein